MTNFVSSISDAQAEVLRVLQACAPTPVTSSILARYCSYRWHEAVTELIREGLVKNADGGYALVPVEHREAAVIRHLRLHGSVPEKALQAQFSWADALLPRMVSEGKIRKACIDTLVFYYVEEPQNAA